MPNTGLVTLGSLRLQAQQRADKVGSPFITTPEWNQYLTSSYKELYDLLSTSYGDGYNVAAPYQFQTVSGQTLYSLPLDFYKLLGLELQVTSGQTTWVTLKPFQFTERNKYYQAGSAGAYGLSEIRYSLVGSNLWLTSAPNQIYTVQMWYVPRPTNLEVTVPVGTTSGSAVVTCTDTSQLAVGMSVQDLILASGATSVVPTGATIASISPNVSFTLSATATATVSGYLVSAWSDQTTFDGISGWEEYVLVDAAMKAKIKEEDDVSALMAQKEALRQRIIEDAQDRDISMPARVSDSNATSWPLGRDPWGDMW